MFFLLPSCMNRGRYSDETLMNLPNVVGGANLPPVTYPPAYLPDINAPQVSYFDPSGMPLTRAPAMMMPKATPPSHIMLWVTGVTLGVIIVLLFTRFAFYSHLD